MQQVEPGSNRRFFLSRLHEPQDKLQVVGSLQLEIMLSAGTAAPESDLFRG